MESTNDLLVTTHSADEKIRYFGQWVPVQEGRVEYRCSNRQYNANEFSFKGSTVKWMGRKGSNQGYADVYLDGEFQCVVDGYSSVTSDGVVKFERSSLRADRIHTLRIVVKKERNPDATDCCQVIAGFQSVTPIHYPNEIMGLKSAEYARIRNGTKSYLTPDTWSPVTNAANVPAGGVTLHPGILAISFIGISPISTLAFRNLPTAVKTTPVNSMEIPAGAHGFQHPMKAACWPAPHIPSDGKRGATCGRS